MRRLTVMGLISGTSMDGIDVAVIEMADRHSSEGRRFELKEFATVAYAPAVRDALLAALDPFGAPRPAYAAARAFAALNFIVGEAFAAAAATVGGSPLRGVDLIGSHGQTIYHLPDDDGLPGFAVSTLQVGEPAVIAARTGVTCVAGFRAADMAAGGHGAPLAPYLDFVALRDQFESRAALNIGGIANLTLLPAGCSAEDVTAFDIGPGNMLIDLAAAQLTGGRHTFDLDGRMAASAAVDETLLAWLRGHPYFQRAAPKTTGREMFGPAYCRAVLERAAELGCSAETTIATITASAARSIAQAVPHETRRIIVSGGGARNPTLMSLLRHALAARPVPAPAISLADEFGLPADAKEAMLFALLAVECMSGAHGNIPRATGARRPVVLGMIAPGENYRDLLREFAAG